MVALPQLCAVTADDSGTSVPVERTQRCKRWLAFRRVEESQLLKILYWGENTPGHISPT